MKSPFTGGKTELREASSELEYRKEKFAYTQRFYVCVDTGIEFTTDDLDEWNLNQAHDQYRAKHGIPSATQIRRTREHYKLPASKMSEILGLGANQYRLYECGEMPSEAIGKILTMISDPYVFLKYIDMAPEAVRTKFFHRLKPTASYFVEHNLCDNLYESYDSMGCLEIEPSSKSREQSIDTKSIWNKLPYGTRGGEA